MKRWILENFWMKALAFFLSLVLWAYVGTRQMLDRRVTVQLELTDIPVGMKVDYSSVKPAIPVMLRGRKDSVLDVDPEELKAVVSLGGYLPGKREMEVRPIVKNLPPGIPPPSVPNITVRLIPQVEPAPPKTRKRAKRSF